MEQHQSTESGNTENGNTEDAVSKIVFATSQAQANKRSESVALTDHRPLAAFLAGKKAESENGGNGENPEPSPEMFEWHINKLPEEEIVPARTVRDVMMAMFLDVYMMRQKHPDWSDEKHRESVLLTKEEYRKLSFTHPRLVLLLCGSECTPRKLECVMELIALRESHETSRQTTEEKQAEVSQYFQSRFIRPAEPGEEERAVAAGTGVRGTLVQGPKR